ncbi:MAG: hypothetical protein V4597_11760 [Pseudomonadota bacterium]
MQTATDVDREYERLFFDNRQVNVTHFFAVNWTEDSEAPIKFAFGYWTHDGMFLQGFVGFSHATQTFGRPVVH